jgi:hypothetical protein
MDLLAFTPFDPWHVIVLILWVVVFGGVGHELGSYRGRGGAGFLLSMLLGPVGWLLTVLLPRTPGNEAAHRLAVAQKMRQLRAAQAEKDARREADVDAHAQRVAAWEANRALEESQRQAAKEKRAAERRAQQEEAAAVAAARAAERTAPPNQVELRCPRCGATLRVPLNTRVTCGACGQRVRAQA